MLKEKHGDIFAVFSSAVYLQANNALCCLVTNNLPGGPLNIQTSLQCIDGLAVGDPWRVTEKQLVLAERYQLSTATMRYQPTHSQYKLDTSSTEAKKLLSNIIISIESTATACVLHRQKADPVSLSTTTHIIKARLEEYCQLISQWLEVYSQDQEKTIPDELSCIIGCGEGLTPAGDDILVGVLVTLRTLGLEPFFRKLRQWVLENASGRTNNISHAHLCAACDGQAIDTLHELLKSIVDAVNTSRNHTGTPPIEGGNAMAKATSELAHYGHSSGFYTLSGVLLVLKYLQRH